MGIQWISYLYILRVHDSVTKKVLNTEYRKLVRLIKMG